MTCDQSDLFGEVSAQFAHEQNLQRLGHRLARTDHPETSKAAADAAHPRLADLQNRVLSLVGEYPARTVSELAQIAGERDPRTIGRRLPELLTQGKVTRTTRICTVTGKSASTWSAA